MHGLPFVLLFVAMTFLSWGAYGPVLHHGTRAMGNDSLRAFVGVGLAYFIIAVIVPVYILRKTGEKGHWSILGTTYSIIAGAVGAVGALGVILALVYKGNPVYVMPIVFGFAPIVNTLVTAWMGKAFKQISGVFIAGILAAACGAGGVLAFKPTLHHTASPSAEAGHTSASPTTTTLPASAPVDSPEPAPASTDVSVDLAPQAKPANPPAEDTATKQAEPTNPNNNAGPSTITTPTETTAPTPSQPLAENEVPPVSAQKSATEKTQDPEKSVAPQSPPPTTPAPVTPSESAQQIPPPVVNPPQIQPATAPLDKRPADSSKPAQADVETASPPPVVNPPQLEQASKLNWTRAEPRAVRLVMALANETESGNSAVVADAAETAEGNMLRIILSIVMAAFCWGAYGPMLHQGQSRMGGSRLRPFICVGLAYFLIAVAAPMYIISTRDSIGQWTMPGLGWSIAAGVAGAMGALGIILAFNAGGKPFYVMPLVFGFAPVVNTFITLTQAGLWSQVEPRFWISLAVVIAGAITVLTNAPKPKPHATPGAKH